MRGGGGRFCCFIEQETSRLRWQQSTGFVASENDLNVVVVGLFFITRSIEEMIPMGLISLYYHMPDVAVIRPLILLIYFCSCWTNCVFFLLYVWLIIQIGTKGRDECTFVF